MFGRAVPARARWPGAPPVPLRSAACPTRYRCSACGNLTRFDVVRSSRTRAFHHYSIGGELTIEEEEVLDERIEQVTCRWCSATGDAIERVPVEESQAEIRRPGL